MRVFDFYEQGELLLRVRRPAHDILESLAAFSHARRRIDNWHFDIAAFPTKRLDVWERFRAITQRVHDTDRLFAFA